MAISQGNKYIISGGYDRLVKVFDLETKHLLHEFKKAHEGPISDISVSKNNEFLVTCSWDKSVKLLQLEIQHCVQYFPDAHKNIVTSVAISPDNKYAVSGSWDKSIVIFDLEAKKEAYRIENAHQGKNGSFSFKTHLLLNRTSQLCGNNQRFQVYNLRFSRSFHQILLSQDLPRSLLYR